MSEGEVLISLLSLVIVAFTIVVGIRAGMVGPGTHVRGAKRTLFATFLAMPAVLLPVLSTIAAKDVRTDGVYILMYLLMGMAWTSLCLLSLHLAGFHAADLTQRHNAAARIFYVGMSIAATLAFAGANVGDGPGFHVVIFAALLSTLTLFGVLIFQGIIARAIYRILVDRDVGLAFRLAALLVAVGLVAGRGVAGTWVSATATMRDFVVVAWPILPVVAMDALISFVTRARDDRPSLAIDVFVGVVYLVAASTMVMVLGVPP